MLSDAWYRKEADKARDRMITYKDLEDTHWTLIKHTKDFYVHRTNSRFPDIPGNVYKGEGVVSMPYRELFHMVCPADDDWSPRVVWDPTPSSIESVTALDEARTLRIIYSRTHTAMMGLISPRDFIDLTLTGDCQCQGKPNYLFAASISIEHPDYPDPTPGFARGKNHVCGFICSEIDGEPGSSKFTMIFQSDAGGSLPKQVVEMAIPHQQVLIYGALKKHVHRLHKKQHQHYHPPRK